MAKGTKKPAAKKPASGKSGIKKPGKKPAARRLLTEVEPPDSGHVLDRLWAVVMSRRDSDPAISHSARLLARGTTKVAQKFGEESVECLIEAVAGNREALINESADVLYHLIVLWVDAGIRSEQVWHELNMREGVSGIAEKASRARTLSRAFGLKTTKIP